MIWSMTDKQAKLMLAVYAMILTAIAAAVTVDDTRLRKKVDEVWGVVTRMSYHYCTPDRAWLDDLHPESCGIRDKKTGKVIPCPEEESK